MLSQHGQAQTEIGAAERQLINEIQKGLLASAKYYLENIWTSINASHFTFMYIVNYSGEILHLCLSYLQTQRRSLELARLDYDSARQKKDACTSEDKIRPVNPFLYFFSKKNTNLIKLLLFCSC